MVRGLGGPEGQLVPTERGKSGPKGVKNEFIQRYFTKNDWATLGSHSFDMTSKIRTLVHRCKLIGLKSMCEQTAKRAAGVLKLASHTGAPDTMNPDPLELLGSFPFLMLWIFMVLVDLSRYLCF